MLIDMVLPYYARISLLLSQTGAERENDVRRGMCGVVSCFYINVRTLRIYNKKQYVIL